MTGITGAKGNMSFSKVGWVGTKWKPTITLFKKSDFCKKIGFLSGLIELHNLMPHTIDLTYQW